jgi:hypothetical protein
MEFDPVLSQDYNASHYGSARQAPGHARQLMSVLLLPQQCVSIQGRSTASYGPRSRLSSLPVPHV